MFLFHSCVSWIRNRAEELKRAHFKVGIKEIGEDQSPKPSIHMRIESSKILADLVVWNSGETSLVIIHLPDGTYITDRSDVILQEDFITRIDELFFNIIISAS